jgi:hypothetical protein
MQDLEFSLIHEVQNGKITASSQKDIPGGVISAVQPRWRKEPSHMEISRNLKGGTPSANFL